MQISAEECGHDWMRTDVDEATCELCGETAAYCEPEIDRTHPLLQEPYASDFGRYA
jgi:hypothetical protein